LKALRGYKSGERIGSDPASAEVAQELSHEDIAAIAHYVAHSSEGSPVAPN
jgi:cytochrome c553